MTVGYVARRSGEQHDSAVCRFDRARAQQGRLADRLASTPDQPCAQERLSAGRAGVASRAQWLHWIDEAESLEPWADGEWAPRAGLSVEGASAGPFAVEQHPGALVELVHAPPGPGSTARAASWVAPALPVCVGPLRSRLAAFAGTHLERGALIADLKLAASEAISNVVIHAYRDRERPGTVTAAVSTDSTAGRVEIVVTDGGVGMTARTDSPGAGLGLAIIAATSDQVTIRPGRAGVGTEIRATSQCERASDVSAQPAGPRPDFGGELRGVVSVQKQISAWHWKATDRNDAKSAGRMREQK
jgi:anti-sigma regulatory factor (Ser/Thr protein kinase)